VGFSFTRYWLGQDCRFLKLTEFTVVKMTTIMVTMVGRMIVIPQEEGEVVEGKLTVKRTTSGSND